MLTIFVGETEHFDESTGEFVLSGGVPLELEHSLVSLSKWESFWEVPFLSNESKSTEQIVSYVKCMTLTPDFPEELYSELSPRNFTQINEYLEKKHTATWFSDEPKGRRNSETITSELIYYWLTAFQIPFEVETWNINRLFTLIRIANAKNQKPKKAGRAETAARNRQLNNQRRAAMNTRG